MKELLTKDTLILLMSCKEDAQGCSLCFSFQDTSLFAQPAPEPPEQSPEQIQCSLSFINT